MRPLSAVLLLIGAAGCSSKPRVDREKVSSGWGYGWPRTSADPCPLKRCAPG